MQVTHNTIGKYADSFNNLLLNVKNLNDNSFNSNTINSISTQSNRIDFSKWNDKISEKVKLKVDDLNKNTMPILTSSIENEFSLLYKYVQELKKSSDNYFKHKNEYNSIPDTEENKTKRTNKWNNEVEKDLTNVNFYLNKLSAIKFNSVDNDHEFVTPPVEEEKDKDVYNDSLFWTQYRFNSNYKTNTVKLYDGSKTVEMIYDPNNPANRAYTYTYGDAHIYTQYTETYHVDDSGTITYEVTTVTFVDNKEISSSITTYTCTSDGKISATGDNVNSNIAFFGVNTDYVNLDNGNEHYSTVPVAYIPGEGANKNMNGGVGDGDAAYINTVLPCNHDSYPGYPPDTDARFSSWIQSGSINEPGSTFDISAVYNNSSIEEIVMIGKSDNFNT